MERFETASLALIPCQRVRAKILSRQPWGLIAEIVGYEDVGASVDMIEQFGRVAHTDAELETWYPPVGAEVDAVVEQVRRWHPPAWARLSVRPEDLRCFRWMCGLCGELATLSPEGDGLVLDVRANDGPGSTTLVSHRECLAGLIRPENTGERARVRKIGRPDT